LNLTAGKARVAKNGSLFIAMLLFICLFLLDSKVSRIEAAPRQNARALVNTPKGMLPSVQRFDSVKEVKYSWGWIRWMMNAELDPGAAQTFGIVQIDAGKRNPLHKHPNCEELLYVLSGSFENVIGDKTVVMHAGDIIRIPANVPHQGINDTKEPMRAVISYSSGTRQMVALGAETE
jgi:quercetin dioxygenase-like cupin family protein